MRILNLFSKKLNKRRHKRNKRSQKLGKVQCKSKRSQNLI